MEEKPYARKRELTVAERKEQKIKKTISSQGKFRATSNRFEQIVTYFDLFKLVTWATKPFKGE